jgi:transcription elongation factor GreA
MTDDARYQITADGLETLKRELETLENEGRREIAERIKIARDFGDLKENSEYHDAKNDQAHLETKIIHLRDRFNNAVIVDSAAGSTQIALGSTVTVRDEESGSESAYELVSATEADIKQGRLSYDSPLARALTGAGVGDVVEFQAPRGTRRLRIVTVS